MWIGPELPLIHELQGQLNLPRRVGGIWPQEASGLLIVAGVKGVGGGDGVLHECGGLGDEAIGGDDDELVVAVEEIERLGDQVELVAFADSNLTSNAQVGGGVVGAGESVRL